jgi:abortive infection bacteriophage resistance protein
MAQAFLTYEQQIALLENDKELTISDSNFAKTILQKISYYSLIDGYKEPFKPLRSGKYHYGVTFEEIYAFYTFDEELRSLFLKYILKVEQHMKSMISYHFCEKYGEHQSGYLTDTNYNLTRKNNRQIQRLVNSLSKAIATPSQYKYINHHAATYGNVPLWVATNALTFGQISKMYQYATSDIRTKISKNFDNISEVQLHQLVTVIARCRNVCAHGERLYDFHIRETIPDMLLHQMLQISTKNNQYTMGKQDLFAVVIALRYLISNDDFKAFKADLTKLINKVPKQCPHLTHKQLLKEMGFPENWEKIMRYKK